jgi:hypothetical protein
VWHGSSNQNNHEPLTHLDLRLIRCCIAKTSSSRSSTCICNRVSWSLELSSSVILHRERVNKVFGNDLRDCSLASSNSSPWLIYLFVGHETKVIAFNANPVRTIIVVKEPQITYGFFSQIMSYLSNMLICVGMILLDNLL